MKNRVFICLMVLLVSLYCQSNSFILIEGVEKRVDTLMHRQIAPGAMYTHLNFPDYPFRAYIITVDLTNEYNRVETFQALDQVGKTEAMTNVYNRLKSSSHTPIGSINGNFWIVNGQGEPNELLGVPHSGSVRNGELVTDPNYWNRGHGAIGFSVIDAERNMWIDDMAFDGKVRIEGVGEYPIAEVNRIRKENELVFFNQYVGEKTRTDDNGTEVFIKPVAGVDWSVNQDVTCEVVRIIKNKGGNEIQEGESVLSGSGEAQVFLNNLSLGQFITVNMGIYTLAENLRPIVKQMVTGNALVMKDGVLTERNYNETYNSQLYPRTGIGMSEDSKMLFMIVIDKYGGYVGATTASMCEILKTVGASNVASMDGGGSAQIMLGGEIINNPSDGKERPVANGWMLFSTAPEDTKIEKIAFADYYVNVPARSHYRPTFIGYNQYGTLCTSNLEGVTLTCDPTLGVILDGNTLVASPEPQEGYLTASYQGIEIKKKISVKESTLSLGLDSIIINNKIEYPIEVMAKASGVVGPINPDYLSWIIEDNTICDIDEGILKGLKNGVTHVEGYIDEILVGKLKVRVEIPVSDPLSFGDFDSSVWEVTSNMPVNLDFKSSGKGAIINYNYKYARNPFIRLARNIELYSIPEAIKLIVSTNKTVISRYTVTIKLANETSNRIINFTDMAKEKDIELIILMKDLLGEDYNPISYPLTFNVLELALDPSFSIENKEYSIELKDFQLCYSDNTVSIIDKMDLFISQFYPNPLTAGNNLFISTSSDIEENYLVNLYSLSGIKVYEGNIKVNEANTIEVPLGNIISGEYLLTLLSVEKKYTCKIIIR